MEDFVKSINASLKRAPLSAKVLLSRFGIVDQNFHTLTDPRYLPFYYYLGKHLKPRRVLEYGVQLGLCSSLFFIHSKECEEYLGLQNIRDLYQTRLARRNLRTVLKKRKFGIHIGSFFDAAFESYVVDRNWDLVLIPTVYPYDQTMQILEFIWDRMSKDGCLIIDRVHYDKKVGEAYSNFCKIKNRSMCVFKTKYGVGLLRK